MLAVLGVLGFSFKAILIKLAYGWAPVDPVTLMALRMLYSAPFFLLMAWRSGRAPGARRIAPRDARLLIGLGFVGYYLSSLLDFLGLQYITASLERLVLFLYPTIVVVLSALFFAQPVTRRAVAALALSYAGIALAVFHDVRITGDPAAIALGSALVFGSAIGYAIYLVSAGGIIGRLGSSRFIAWAMLASTVFIIVQFALTRPVSALAGAVVGAGACTGDGGVLHGAADVDDRRIDPAHGREHGVARGLARPDVHDRLRRADPRRTDQPPADDRRGARAVRRDARLARRRPDARRAAWMGGTPFATAQSEFNVPSIAPQGVLPMAPDTLERSSLDLTDPSLLRQKCYVDGQWIDADDRGFDAGRRPGDRRVRRHAPMFHAAETKRAIDAASRAFPAWRAKTAKERGAILRKWNDLMLANADDLARILTAEQGKPLAEAKGEITIGAAYVEWFAEEAQAHLRRRHPDDGQRPPPRRRQGAGRRLRGDHAVEFPIVDDHAQGFARARSRLHRRHQAGGSDAVFRVRARRTRRARRLSAGRPQRRHRRCTVDRRRDVRQSHRAQALVHGLNARSAAC